MSTAIRPARIGWVLVLLFAAGVLLRALRLAWQPLWWDEGYSVYFATEPLARMVALTAQDIHPPLYYALLHLWIQLWGSAQPVVDRMLSVLLGVAALPLQAWLAWTLYPGRRRILVVAVLLLALSPMHLFYSQEVRMYGLGLTLSTASTACFWRWLRRLDRGDSAARWLLPALGYVVFTTAGLYTLYYFAFVPAGHLLWALIHYRRTLRRFGAVVAAQAVVVLLYLPWIVYAVPRLVTYVGAKVQSDQDAALDPVSYLARHLGAYTGGHLPWLDGATPWPLFFGLAAVLLVAAGLALARRRPASPEDGDRAATALLVTLLGVAFAGGWLVSLRYPFFPEGGERLLLFALPYALLLLAVAIDRTWRVYFTGAAALVLLLVAGAAGIYVYYTTPRYSAHDYRPILRQIVQQGRNEDTLLAIFPWQVGYWRAYTPQDDAALSGPAPLLLTAANDAVAWSPAVQATLDEALHRGAIWFPEPLSFGSSLPGEIEEYLAGRSANLENRWYDATRLTAWADLPAPAPVATTHDFGAVQLVAAATTPDTVAAANEPVSVLLTWRVAEPADLNVSLRLLDDQGDVWSSREYAAAWSGVAPGAEVTEQVGLVVPVGLPPGAYQVGVSVARQQADGGSAEALTLAGSDLVDALIGQATVTAPTEPQPAARLPIRTPLSPAVVQDGIAFLGFTGPDAERPLLAGTELGLTLFLQAQEDAPSPRSLYVSLLDGSGNGVAGYEGWPLPDYAADLLSRDELLRLPVRFFVPGVIGSGDYRLAAGFVDAATGAKRAPVTLGEVRIEQRRAAFDRRTPAQLLPTPAQFGTHALLYGYDRDETEAGDVLIRLYWEIVQPLLPPHHIFVHADDAGGATLAQQDGPPVTVTGPAPSGSWQPGEFLITEHRLRVPPDTVVNVGIYEPATTVRLPVTVDGQPAGDSVRLASTP